MADDAAVSMAAAHAARVVLDIADGNAAHANAGWLLLGFRKSWVFDGHGHAIWLDVGNPSPTAPDEPDDSDTKAFILSVFKEAVDACPDPE